MDPLPSLPPIPSTSIPLETPAVEKKDKTEEVGYFEKGVLWLKERIWKVILAVMQFFGFWKEEAQATEGSSVECATRRNSTKVTPASIEVL